jgi:hypothetical protein
MDVLSSYYEAQVKLARDGDIATAQKLLKESAGALREHFDTGGANIRVELAEYLADCLEQIAERPEIAKHFCLNMPKHRPRKDDESLHRQRALAVIQAFQTTFTLNAALEKVAKAEQKSVDAIRASFEKARNVAGVLFLLRTPKNKRGEVKQVPRSQQKTKAQTRSVTSKKKGVT